MNIFTRLITEAASKALGMTTPRRKRGLTPQPYWTQELNDLSRIVKKNGRRLAKARKIRGHRGMLAEEREGVIHRASRSKYRKAIRQAKRQYYHDIKSEWDMGDASMREINDTLRRFKGSHVNRTIPHSLETMTNAWRPVLATKPPKTKLLNECDVALKECLERWQSRGRDLVNEAHAVSLEETYAAIAELKKRKATGIDLVSNEALKALGKPAVQMLADAMTEILRDPDSTPSSWCRALVCMIPKVFDRVPTPLEYRPISLLSCLSKLMEKVIMNRMRTRENLEPETPFTAHAQGGFKQQREASECTLRIILAHHLAVKLGVPLHVVLFDMKKAFDSVPHPLMNKRLSDLGLPDYMVRYFHFNTTGRTSDRQGHSRRILADHSIDRHDTTFDIGTERGAPQGGVLSPDTYNITMNPLSNERVVTQNGVDGSSDYSVSHISGLLRFTPRPGRETAGETTYADDLATFDTNAKRLASRIVNHVEAYVNQSGMVMNGSPKTVSLILGSTSNKSNKKTAKKLAATFKLNGSSIEVVDTYKHLGTYLSKAILVKNKLDNSKSIEQLHVTANNSKRIWGANTGTPVCVGAAAARGHAYGAQFSGCELMEPQDFQKMNSALGIVAKTVLYDDLKSGSIEKSLRFLGWPSAELCTYTRVVSFALRLCSHPVPHMRKEYLHMFTPTHAGDCENRWSQYVLRCVKKLNEKAKTVDVKQEFDNFVSSMLAGLKSDKFSAEHRVCAKRVANKIKNDVRTRPHPIVRVSLPHAHHSYIFFRTGDNFNPTYKDVPPCYLCGVAGGDTQRHLVEDCLHPTIVHVMNDGMKHFDWDILTGDDSNMSRAIFAQWLLSPWEFMDDDTTNVGYSMSMFTDENWRQLSIIHFRLYRPRKIARDLALNRGSVVRVDSRQTKKLLAADMQGVALPISIIPTEWRYHASTPFVGVLQDDSDLLAWPSDAEDL